MTEFRIKHHEEETCCSECGEPLFVGDKAILDDPDVFCSRSCALARAERELIQYRRASMARAIRGVLGFRI